MPTIDEANKDLEQTKIDIQYLVAAKSSIQDLINKSEIENKEDYVKVLRHLESNISEGFECKLNIENWLKAKEPSHS